MAKKQSRNGISKFSNDVRRFYGWIPDVPDHRDLMYSVPMHVATPLPAAIDLRSQCPKEIYDQGQLGSCTANAIAAAHQFDQMKQGASGVFMPSLFIYYDERLMEGTIGSDAGAQIRDGVKTLARQGVCPEEMWPYLVDEFTLRPTAACYNAALGHRAVRYLRVPQMLSQMKGCLAEGYPFVFGFSVYESFDSQQVADTGIAPMPTAGEQFLGGHAVLAVGYDDAQQRFIVRNSWGADWGLNGYFTIPYAYLLDTNLSDDFWTVRQVK